MKRGDPWVMDKGLGYLRVCTTMDPKTLVHWLNEHMAHPEGDWYVEPSIQNVCEEPDRVHYLVEVAEEI